MPLALAAITASRREQSFALQPFGFGSSVRVGR